MPGYRVSLEHRKQGSSGGFSICLRHRIDINRVELIRSCSVNSFVRKTVAMVEDQDGIVAVDSSRL